MECAEDLSLLLVASILFHGNISTTCQGDRLTVFSLSVDSIDPMCVLNAKQANIFRLVDIDGWWRVKLTP